MGSTDSPQISQVQNAGITGLSGDINTKAKQYLDQGFGNVPQQTVVGFNPYQQSTMGALQALYATPNPLTGAASGYAADVLGGKYLDPSSNPALKASADAVTGQAQRFLNSNLDNVDSTFGLYGGTGGSAQANAKARQVTDAGTGLSSALAALYGNAYGQERGMQQSILPEAQGLAQDPLSRALGALQLGGLQQGMAQQQADLPFQNFMARMGIQGNSLQGALGALSGINSTYYQPMYQPSEFSQNFGMAMQGLNTVANVGKSGAAMYAASDRRLKTDLSPLGMLGAFKIYSFRYLDGLGLPEGPRVGVMADEVERVLPRAVVVGPLGYKLVDYAQVWRSA